MNQDTKTEDPRERERDALAYEPPRIEDYGTLAELTAGKGNGNPDLVGHWEKHDGGGGGYS